MSIDEMFGYDVFVSDPIPEDVPELLPNGERRVCSPITSTLIQRRNEAGARRPAAGLSPGTTTDLDDDAARVIAQTRRYLDDADDLLARNALATDFFSAMIERCPERRLGATILWNGAKGLYAHSGDPIQRSRTASRPSSEPSRLRTRSKEHAMPTIHLHETTTATPEQFVAGLTDFGPGRAELFGNSADQYLKVHGLSPGRADVTEGSRGTWERLDYDWSDPARVVLKTTDSNAWGGKSGYTYTLTRQPGGKTHVDEVIVREGKNLKGKAFAIVLGAFGKQVLGKQLGKTVKAIEARNYGEQGQQLQP